MEITTSQADAATLLRQIQFGEWYPLLKDKKLTYKSKIFPLSDLFVRVFLKQDKMC
jgi:hypothetical protein